ADEIVQETWLAVIEHIGSFDGRSSVKNWVFAILTNKARTRARRDGRTTALEDPGNAGEAGPAVAPDRFDAAGSWKSPPALWDEITPERVVGGREVLAHVNQAIEALPALQKAVLMMVEDAGLDQREAAALLGIEPNHLRVLLHRARASIRASIAGLLGE
ncbi:MAG TPA: sigma-70 family RNA polymerase sigma factor, partial [Devosiaceae bacterium]|nr:sigma-70 family RNA polymerase sigma factor [Devosiaceae bacterium]